MMKVLVFPAGSEIGLEIHNALKYSKDVEIYGATSVSDHSEVVYKKLFDHLPKIDDQTFISCLNDLIDEAKIDFIFPALDSVQLFLIENAGEVNAQIISAPEKTVRICRSKSKTYKLFEEFWFVPKVYQSSLEVDQYPVFVKPDEGQGAQGVELVYSPDRLNERLDKEDIVVCEYLPGDEFTIDCLTHDGDLVYAGARRRERIKSGIAVRSSRVECTGDMMKIAKDLNGKLDFRGAWFFQIKMNNQGEFRLLEVSPRIPGTSVVSRSQGINLPILTLYSFLGSKYSVTSQRFSITVERAFINRFVLDLDYSVVFMDLDDTLILKNEVNITALSFLYQLQNQGKEAVLLTRHKGDVLDYLDSHHIDPRLFSKIIKVDGDSEKADYIDNVDAIFIDDSFVERTKVMERKHIPVFDVDSIEALLDWRM